MDTEQKAKAYDRALEIAKAWCKLDSNDLSNDDLETLFPELKESEDERIRKGIIRCVIGNMPDSDIRKKYIAWLEKQGEQKPFDTDTIKKKAHQIAWEISKHYDPNACKQEWCEMAAIDMASWIEKQGEHKFILDENDDWIRTKIIKVLLDSELTPEETNECIFWLKSLKDRTFPQPKQEWSEEDEKKRKRIMHRLSIDGTINNEDLADINEWLKSLRLQSHWKPSDEQMSELENYIGTIPPYEPMFQIFKSLYNDLKKLTEE